MAPVPVDQRLGLARDGGVARRQQEGSRAHFLEAASRPALARFHPGISTANSGWRPVQPQKDTEAVFPLAASGQNPARSPATKGRFRQKGRNRPRARLCAASQAGSGGLAGPVQGVAGKGNMGLMPLR